MRTKDIRAETVAAEDWTLVIKPGYAWYDLHLKELWKYRDLVLLFVRRDFATFYKQTILGPLWYLIQPAISTIVFSVVFGQIAGLPTEGIPSFLFYLSGTIVWGYFSASLTQTSNTFLQNAAIFGKVYFPRLTVPISIAIINFAQFFIQFTLFLAVYIFYALNGSLVRPTLWIIGTPLILLQMALLGLGTGILISSLTTKYRDLTFVMTFGVQLWMYATPIVYPSSMIREKYRFYYMLNPMAQIVDSFRLAFLGTGEMHWLYFITSWSVTIIIFTAGMGLFSRVEKTFMDTV